MSSQIQEVILDIFQDIYPPNFDNSTDSKYVKLFPEFEAIFGTESYFCQGIIYPLCSLNLKLLDSNLPSKKLHLVHFNDDPYESTRVFNECCSDYEVAFDLVGDKYIFKGNKDYFNHSQGWEQWIQRTRADYEQVLLDYKETKFLLRRYPDSNLIEKEFIFSKIGGIATFCTTELENYPVNDLGEKFMFVAEYYACNFCKDDAKIYELFFDIKSNRVVLRWAYA